MKKYLYIVIGLIIGSAGVVYAAPSFNYSRTIIPESNTTFDLGSSSPARLWNNIYTSNLVVNSQAGTGGCAYFDGSGNLLGGTACSGGGGGGSGGGWSTSSAASIITAYPNNTSSLVGINSSTPWAVLTVKGISGTTTPTFVVASSTNAALLTVASNGSTTVSSLGAGLVRSTSGGALYVDTATIPLSASTTNWNTFYDTPSTRITAGNNLSWSGNTLNGTMASSTIIAGGTATHSPFITFATSTDTNILTQVVCASSTCTFTPSWTGTLAAARLNSNVVQSVVNDTNVTGSIATQALTLGWTGQLSVARGGTGTNTLASLLVSSTNLSITGGQSVLVGTGTTITLTDTPTFTTVNTGQGAYELYAMNQDVLQASNVTFNNQTLTGTLGVTATSTLATTTATRLGVGTTTPLVPLVVVGSSTFTSLNSAACDVKSGTNGGLYCGIDANTGGGSGNSAWTIGNGLIHNATSTDEVGIGTSTPTATLDIQGNGLVNPFSITSSTGASIFSVTAEGYVRYKQLVSVIHADGTMHQYNATTSTDVARGQALRNALAAAVTGDSIYLADATFDIGANRLDLSLGGTGTVHLHGSGKYATVIRSSFNSETQDQAIVHPGNDSETTDLSIIGTIQDTANTFQFPWGGEYGEPFFRNALLKNVYLFAESDAVYVASTNSSATIVNITAESYWDTVFAGQSGTALNIYDSVFSVVGTTTVGTARAMRATTNAVINSFNNTISVVSATSSNQGYYTEFGAIANVHGGKITTASTSPMDLYNDLSNAGTINVAANTAYDVAKTTGAVSYLDKDSIRKSLTYGTINVGLGSTTPSAMLVVQGTSTSPTARLFVVSSSTNSTLFEVAYNGSTTLSSLSAASCDVKSAAGLLYCGIDATGGGSLSGGIPGFVTRWTGATSVSTGVLYDDATVAGVSATSSTIAFNIQGTSSLDPLQVGTSTKPAMLIVKGSTGRVGIGTSTPGQFSRLHVEGDTDTNAIPLTLETPIAGSQVLQQMYAPQMPVDNSLSYNWLSNDSAGNKTTFARFGVVIRNKTDGSESGDIGFFTNGSGSISEKFTIQGNGNVGVGSTSPQSKLTLVGTSGSTSNVLNVASSTGLSQLSVGSNGSTTIANLNAASCDVKSDAGALYCGIDATGGGSLSGGIPGFVTRWTSGTTVSTGVIYDNASVAGVNATSSTIAFNIQGTGAIDPLRVGTSTNTSMLMVKGDTGRVGIGTSTPTSRLVVEAGDSSSSLLLVATTTNQKIFAISELGRVGIGTTTPQDKFEVVGGNIILSNTYALQIRNTLNNPVNVFTLDATGYAEFGHYSGGINGYEIGSQSLVQAKGDYNTNDFQIFTGGTERFMVDTDGNVGVNTGTPTATLTVKGIAGTRPMLVVASSTETSILTITHQGRVGLNTSTPSSLFHVTSPTANATSTVEFGRAGQTKGFCMVTYNQAGTKVWVYINAANAWTVSTVSCE